MSNLTTDITPCIIIYLSTTVVVVATFSATATMFFLPLLRITQGRCQ